MRSIPPPAFAWQIDKTAASIAFVNGAERHIATCSNAADVGALKQAIEEIKQGKRVLEQWLTANEFLAAEGSHLH